MSNRVQVLCSKAAVHNQAVYNHKDYLLAYNSTYAHVMAHIIAQNTFYCIPDWIWKGDAYVCARVHTYAHRPEAKWLVDISLSRGVMTIAFTWFSLIKMKLCIIYFLAGDSCTSLGCLYFHHHWVADQQLNLYRRVNTKWLSLTEHISIVILIIRPGFALHPFFMQYQVEGPNPYFRSTQWLSNKISKCSKAVRISQIISPFWHNGTFYSKDFLSKMHQHQRWGSPSTSNAICVSLNLL